MRPATLLFRRQAPNVLYKMSRIVGKLDKAHLALNFDQGPELSGSLGSYVFLGQHGEHGLFIDLGNSLYQEFILKLSVKPAGSF